MRLSAPAVNRTAISKWPGGWLSKSWLVLSSCLLMTCLLSPAHAEVIVVLDEDFETDPPNFQIGLQQNGVATASFEFGDVGTSRGLTFIGTYQTVQGVDVYEYAYGSLNPVVPTVADHHLYPAETGGVNSITVSMDAIVEGLPSDNGNSLEKMGFGLQLWQKKDGQWDVYLLEQVFINTTWEEIGWSNLTAEDFMREDMTMPDFSATAEPIAFGFYVGIAYKWLSGPGLFISTSARLDNWKVEADVGDIVFRNGFEQ